MWLSSAAGEKQSILLMWQCSAPHVLWCNYNFHSILDLPWHNVFGILLQEPKHVCENLKALQGTYIFSDIIFCTPPVCYSLRATSQKFLSSDLLPSNFHSSSRPTSRWWWMRFGWTGTEQFVSFRWVFPISASPRDHRGQTCGFVFF